MTQQFTITWRWKDDDPNIFQDVRELCDWLRTSAPVPQKIEGVSWNVVAEILLDPEKVPVRDDHKYSQTTPRDSEPTRRGHSVRTVRE